MKNKIKRIVTNLVMISFLACLFVPCVTMDVLANEQINYIEKTQYDTIKSLEHLNAVVKATSANDSDNRREQFVQFARDNCLNVPYKSGGRTKNGFDCCGLVWYVCNHFGIDVGRGNNESQMKYGEGISYSLSSYDAFLSVLKPGDLIFFDYNPSDSHPSSHVGIYSGNGKIIQAHRQGVNSKEDKLSGGWIKGSDGKYIPEWKLTCAVRRVIPDSKESSCSHEYNSSGICTKCGATDWTVLPVKSGSGTYKVRGGTMGYIRTAPYSVATNINGYSPETELKVDYAVRNRDGDIWYHVTSPVPGFIYSGQIYYALLELKYLDLNGILDGEKKWDINGLAKADIYIDGTRVAQNVSDYCDTWPKGSSYEIRIRNVEDGYTYNDSVYTGAQFKTDYVNGSLKGTLNADTSVAPSFSRVIRQYQDSVYSYACGLKFNEGDDPSKTCKTIQKYGIVKKEGESFTVDTSHIAPALNGFTTDYIVGTYDLDGPGTATEYGTWTSHDLSMNPLTVVQKPQMMNFYSYSYPTEYKITYNLNGGTNNPDNPSTYNVIYGVNFKAPTKEGAHFDGWYIGDTKVSGINSNKNAGFMSNASYAEMASELNKRTTGDVVVTAKWREPVKLTVKGLVDGQLVDSIEGVGRFDLLYDETSPWNYKEAHNNTSFSELVTYESYYRISNVVGENGYVFGGFANKSDGTTSDEDIALDEDYLYGDREVYLKFYKPFTSYTEVDNVQERSYNGHLYYYCPGLSMTWDRAENFCEEMGGHLLVINNREEDKFIYNYLSETRNNEYHLSLWEGVTDRNTEGVWESVTGETDLYLGWADGSNTENDERDTDDYLVVGYYWDEEWADDWGESYDTDGTGLVNFICEIDSLQRPEYPIRISAKIDGQPVEDLSELVSFDLYVEGSRIAKDTSINVWNAGLCSVYTIKNIRVKNGFAFDGFETTDKPFIREPYEIAYIGDLPEGTVRGDTEITLLFHSVKTSVNDAPVTDNYNGNTYHYFPTPVTWYDAKNICEQMGGHLATISDEDERNFVFSLISNPASNTWLGASDLDEENEWKWVTEEPFDYINWASDAPDNHFNDNLEGCENFLSFTAGGNKLFDDQAGCNKYPFICEIEGEHKAPAEYTVTFESDGGSEVAAQTVKNGKPAAEPEAPVKEGFVFAGWYDGETPYDFSQPVTKDTVLTAHWDYTYTFVDVNTTGNPCTDRLVSKAHWVRNDGVIFVDEAHTETAAEEDVYTGPLGHAWTNWTTVKEPTCSEPGSQLYQCTRCWEKKYEEIPATNNHVWSEWEVIESATEESEGRQRRFCHECGKEETAVIPAGGHVHNLEFVQGYPAGCETDGMKDHYRCTEDENHIFLDAEGTIPATKESIFLPATGHRWNGGTIVIEPSCVDGLRVLTCMNDSSHKLEEKVTPGADAGHAWDEGVIVTEATCETPGVKVYTCTKNPEHTYTTGIVPLGHDWEDGVVTKEPGCEEEGVRTYVCRRDPSHTIDQAIPAVGHKWGEWIVKKEAAPGSEGEMYRVCEHDKSHVETSVIPAKEEISLVERKAVGYEVPEDLWAIGVPDELVYDGTAKTFELQVYNGETPLVKGRDYELKFFNNKNAGVHDLDEAGILNFKPAKKEKKPYVMVSGKGNYTGKIYVPFNIYPAELEFETVPSVSVKYNKKVQKPSPKVLWGRTTLKNKTDYTLSYLDTEGNPCSPKEVGNYIIHVEGKGNFEGSGKDVPFIIEAAPKLASSFNVKFGKIRLQDFDEAVITVQDLLDKNLIAVTYGKKKEPVVYGTDYEIELVNSDSAGTATAYIEGIGDYYGTKTVTFKIEGTPIKNAAILSAANAVFTGEEIKTGTVSAKVGYVLQEGEDYELTYTKNINAGTATVTLKGIGAYSGTLKKSFKILPEKFSDNPDAFAVSAKAAVYSKGGTKTDVVVTKNGVPLSFNQDFTVKYSNTKNIGTGTVTVTGKGNYRGTLTQTFTINPKPISSGSIAVKDKVSGVKMYSAVTITDTDGKKLAAGKDYAKPANSDYTYVSDTLVMNGSSAVMRHAGDAVQPKDVAPAGTLIKVTVTGKGNYTGAISAEYRILAKNKDISKASVRFILSDGKTASKLSKVYTGNEIFVDKSELKVTVNKQVLTNDDYEIISYSNNVKKGTATVTIRGLGDYGGVKTFKFRIVSEKMTVWEKLFGGWLLPA